MNFAEIHNLSDTAAWDAAGNWAKPILRWSTSEPDGDPVSYYRVRIYTASSGGVAAFDTTQLAGNPGVINANYAMPNLTSRWWTIETWDSMGESSGESTRTVFQVCWGQAIYQYAVPSGATSSGWGFSAPSAPTNTLSAFLFRSGPSAGGAGASAWSGDISLLVPNAYLNVLVRLSTYVSGTDATLTDMLFTYLGSASQPAYYVFSPSGDWALDPGAFRYGTKGLKFVVPDNTTDRLVYPYRVAAGDDLACAANTRYVYSCFVKTDGPLGAGSDLRLQLYAGGGFTTLLTEGTVVNGGATTDTTSSAEQWSRLVLPFTTLPGQTAIRPVVRYHNGGAGSGDQGWIDGIQFEEGVVVSPWHSNQLSMAGILDGYGLRLDAMAGASVTARASDGTIVDLDDIVHAAAGGGGGGGLGSGNIVWVEPGTLPTDLVTI